jgi:hypothetical protein
MNITLAEMPEAPVWIFEFVALDRIRALFVLGMEIIIVGKDTATRVDISPWECRPIADLPLPDPKPQWTGEVSVTRLGPVMIDGARTRGYQLAIAETGSTSTSNHKLFVLEDGGLPRRLEDLDAAGNVTGTIDYYDFNVPISIGLPKCATQSQVPAAPSPGSAVLSQVSASKGNLKNLATALEAYLVDHGNYPTTLTDLAPDYLRGIPNDPCTDTVYLYTTTGSPAKDYKLSVDFTGSQCASIVPGLSYTPDGGLKETP